jgi:hypothetical protein
MDDHPTPDPAGQSLHLRPVVTTTFEPYPGVTIEWWEAVGLPLKGGAWARFILVDDDGTEEDRIIAIGRAVLRVDALPGAYVDAVRDREGILIPRLVGSIGGPLPGLHIEAAERLIAAWRALMQTVQSGQSVRGRRPKVTAKTAEDYVERIRSVYRSCQGTCRISEPSQNHFVNQHAEAIGYTSTRGFEDHLRDLRLFGYTWPESYR